MPGASLGDFQKASRISDETMDAARRTVCAHATDADDARQLMLALGILPGQEIEEDIVVPHMPVRGLDGQYTSWT